MKVVVSPYINNIKEKWQYQYPELQAILTNIQEVINTDQGKGEDLTIPLPKNIQDRDATLQDNLREDLTEITNAYKQLYQVGVDLTERLLTPPNDQKEQEEFKRLCNEYFTQELDEINAQQEPIKTLAKLRQEGKQEEYHKHLQALVDEDLKKRSNEEILAKILSSLAEDNPPHHTELLQNFVETKVRLQETEAKLSYLVKIIPIYEKELQEIETNASQLAPNTTVVD